MFRLDPDRKQLVPLASEKFSQLGLQERFDVQEWIEKTPSILGEDLLIIGKELVLPSRSRLDLLAVDRQGRLVVIELERDNSGRDVEWQAIRYVSYCSNFLPDDIYTYFAEYLQADQDEAQLAIEEFMDEELEALNVDQRIVLVAQEFHSDVVSAVLWLRDREIDIRCVRLQTFVDSEGELFITPDIIIPLPEARDYMERREAKQKAARKGARSTFSLEVGDFNRAQLEERLRRSLTRSSDLTPRFVAFLRILLSADRPISREDVRQRLFEHGIGSSVGQAGRYLSNVSQFLTKKSNPHLRQVIGFDSGGRLGDPKDNYRVAAEYRDLVETVLDDLETADGS